MAASVFYFTVYSFMGWLLENSYNYFKTREFYKPNFLYGPFKPMYGLAPLLLLNLIGTESSWPVVVLLSFFIPTLVEYVSGYLLKKLFHRQWWDYSDMPLQLQGHICLPFSLCWILLSIILVKLIHPIMASLYSEFMFYWVLLYPAVTLYFIIDFLLTARKHSLLLTGWKPT